MLDSLDDVSNVETWTAVELRLRDAYFAGRELDLTSSDSARNDPFGADIWEDDRTIRAEVIGALLQQNTDNELFTPPVRFRLQGARISGRLDLGCGRVAPFLFQSCRFDESPFLNDAECSFLGFLSCVIPGLIAQRMRCSGAVWLDRSLFTGRAVLEDAQMYDLSAKATRVECSDGFCLCGSRVERDLILESLESTGKVCFSRSQIGGQLDLSGAILSPGAQRSAIVAYQVAVGGTVYMLNEFSAQGLINFEGAKIGGALFAIKASITNGDRIAFDLDHAEVGLGFRAQGISVGGILRIHHARIGCQMQLDGAKLSNPNGVALQADHVLVEGAFLMSNGFEAQGSIDLHGATLICSWTLGHAQVTKGRAEPVAIYATQMKLDGHLNAHGIAVEGGVNLNGLAVSGDVNLPSANLKNEDKTAISLREAEVGGSVVANDQFETDGEFRLSNAKIGTKLDISDARLNNKSKVAIAAAGMEVAGEVNVSGTEAHGLVDFAAAKIGGSLRATDARLLGVPSRESTFGTPNDVEIGGRWRGIALRAPAAAVAGDIDMRGASLGESLNLQKARVARALLLNDARVGSDSGLALDLSGLQAETLALHLKERLGAGVDLAGANISMLDDSKESWPESASIRLDGFEYRHLQSGQDVSARLALLARSTETFSAHTYEQLANFYVRNGQDDHARKVRLAAIRRQRASSPPVAKIWGWVQDGIIGYGYASSRALALAVGLWVAAGLALMTAAPTCTIGGSQVPGLCPVKADEHPTWDPWLYTLDLLVPVVDLGHGNAWDPTGWSKTLMYTLTVAGWILATTVIAAAARILKRP